MDVWFDSGSSHGCSGAMDDQWPADLYWKARPAPGWFHLRVDVSSCAGISPRIKVLTRLYSDEGANVQSVSNTVAPEIIDRYGADMLRQAPLQITGRYPVSPDSGTDVRCERIATIRFMLGNLADFQPGSDRVPREKLPEVDRYILAQFYRLTERVIKAYGDYEFHTVYHGVHNFCTVDLGSFYLDIIKDRLYCDAPDSLSRRAAQTVICEILAGLVRLIAPILVHTAEEAWEHLPEELRDVPSVHFSTWPTVEKGILDENAEDKWAEFMAIRREVAKALELARTEKAIGSSNDAGVTLYPDAELCQILSQFDTPELEALFIVSEVGSLIPGCAPDGA